jgi:hypothetical protein
MPTEQLPIVSEKIDLGELTRLWVEEAPSLFEKSSVVTALFWDPAVKKWYKETDDYSFLRPAANHELKEYSSSKHSKLVGPVYTAADGTQQFWLYQK